ncbi:hypothetical protein MNBD_GAMMA07-249, partial [hydrothermal vent metagenome]
MKIALIISIVLIGISVHQPAFSEENISQLYPKDLNIINNPAVLFHENFETGWGRWDSPSSDTKYLFMENDNSIAHYGNGFLRSTVTKADLQADMDTYISSSTTKTLDTRVDKIYWRFYARMKGVAPNPHHWVRMSAGDANYYSSGLANTVPSGDRGFWFDFDITNDDTFNFYNYWYKMHSGRCNDGTVIPGCEGDQGTTYFYGNKFVPPNQAPFSRDKWMCIEIMGKTNDLNTNNGELAFWVDDKLIENYRIGNPVGTWLRDTFHTNG